MPITPSMHTSRTPQKAVAVAASLLTLALPLAAGEFSSAIIPDGGGGGASAPRWRLSIGGSARSFGDIDFRGGSSLTPGDIPDFFPATGAGFFAPPETGYADRRYDDGFVLVGPGTAATGLTQGYGYRDASQIIGTPDMATGLAFHATSGTTLGTETILDDSLLFGSSDPGTEAGVHLRLDRLRPADWNGRKIWFGPSVGLDLFRIRGGQSAQTLTGSQRAYQETQLITDTFAFPATVIAPSAPFNFPEGGSAPGVIPMNPLLGNEPVSRSVSSGTSVLLDEVLLSNRLAQELEIDLYTFSFGGALEVEQDCWSAGVFGGITVNIADANYQVKESLFADGQSVDSYSRNSDDLDVLLGFYIGAQVGYQVTERLSLQAFGRYDGAQDMRSSAGVNSYDFDPSGWSAGVSVGITF